MSNNFKAQITGYGYDGEGVARVEGKVVFIPFALRGEKIEGEIKDSRASFCRGKIIEIKKASPLRENPPCPYFSKCGGCTYQHTTYQNELDIKKELLLGQLKKVGYEGEIQVRPSIEYGYRNKIRLFVSPQGLSLKQRSSGKLCTIDKCLLISDEMNRAIGIINSFLKAGNLFGKYKEVVIRQENNQLLVVFFKSQKNIKVNYQGLFLRLGSNFGIFEKFDGLLQHKIGLTSLKTKEFGLDCQFKPTSFHQVNSFLTEKLYQTAIEEIEGKTVVNCYSGAGVLSGAIAIKGKRVVAIELGKDEHNDAEELKNLNNLFYLTNLNGDCAEVMPRIEEKIDSVIVDPPRSGMDQRVVGTLNNLNFSKLLYISCNSATLVRDLGRLNNFDIKKVFLFDMFARTGEYETLVVLEKIK